MPNPLDHRDYNLAGITDISNHANLHLIRHISPPGLHRMLNKVGLNDFALWLVLGIEELNSDWTDSRVVCCGDVIRKRYKSTEKGFSLRMLSSMLTCEQSLFWEGRHLHRTSVYNVSAVRTKVVVALLKRSTAKVWSDCRVLLCANVNANISYGISGKGRNVQHMTW